MDETRQQIEDSFVRAVYVGASHVKRYNRFYAVGAAWVAVIALVSPIGNAVPAVGRVSDEVAAAPASDVVDTDKVPFAGGAPDSDAGGSSDFSDFSDEVASSTAPDDAPRRVGSGELDGDSEPNAPIAGPLPAALNPALAAGGPTLGKGCDTVGLAMLVATLAAPASPVPLPLSEVSPAVMPVYLACAQIPRPEARLVCESDAAVPEVPGSPVPVNPGASAAVVEQAQVAERQAPAQVGAANQLAALMGCRPLS